MLPPAARRPQIRQSTSRLVVDWSRQNLQALLRHPPPRRRLWLPVVLHARCYQPAVERIGCMPPGSYALTGTIRRLRPGLVRHPVVLTQVVLVTVAVTVTVRVAVKVAVRVLVRVASA